MIKKHPTYTTCKHDVDKNRERELVGSEISVRGDERGDKLDNVEVCFKCRSFLFPI